VRPLLCEAGPVSEALLRSPCRRSLSTSVHDSGRSVPVTHCESASLDARTVSRSTPVRTTPRVSLSGDLPADERTEVARLKMAMAALQVASPLGFVVSCIMSSYSTIHYYYYLGKQVTRYPPRHGTRPRGSRSPTSCYWYNRHSLRQAQAPGAANAALQLGQATHFRRSASLGRHEAAQVRSGLLHNPYQTGQGGAHGALR